MTSRPTSDVHCDVSVSSGCMAELIREQPKNGRRRRNKKPPKTFFLRGMLLGALLGSGVTAAAINWSLWGPYTKAPIKELAAATNVEIPEVVFTFANRLKESTVESDDSAYVVPKAAGSADFWVRAASFKKKDRADSLRGFLTLLNLPVEASASEVNEQVWHLVSIGPYKKEVEAQRVLTRLRQENLQPSLVKVFDK